MQFDLGEAIAAIETFGARNVLDRSTTHRMQVATEELGVQILRKRYGEQTLALDAQSSPSRGMARRSQRIMSS